MRKSHNPPLTIGYYKYTGISGERWFWLTGNLDDKDHKRVMQVCLWAGNEKRGRAHCVGVYEISYMTLSANYAWNRNNFHECTKEEYDLAFSKVVEHLKNFEQSKERIV